MCAAVAAMAVDGMLDLNQAELHSSSSMMHPSATTTTTAEVGSVHQNDAAPASYASHLKCFVLQATMEERPDMTLGFPLNIYRDNQGRFRMELIPDLVSYEGHELVLVRNSLTGVPDLKILQKKQQSLPYIGLQWYNTWLPIYVNATHFARARGMIENTISVLSRGAVDETAIHNQNACKVPFKPSMVLDVLPLLMNKMMYRLVTCPLNDRFSATLAFWQLLRLFVAMLETYPTLQQELDTRVKRFRQEPKYRHKDTIPDMGAFFIQSSCATTCSFVDMKKDLADEWFVRQIVWMFRNDTSSSSSGTAIRSQLMVPNGRPNYPLQACFDATGTANRLFVLYWFVMWRVLDFGTVQNRRTQIMEMDERFGCISDSQREILNAFIDTLELRVKCYSDMWPLIHMEDIFKTDDDVQAFLLRCERKSFDCGYHGKKPQSASATRSAKRPSRGR